MRHGLVIICKNIQAPSINMAALSDITEMTSMLPPTLMKTPL